MHGRCARDFHRFAFAIAILALIPWVGSCTQAPQPDLAIINANILTVDSTNPRAEAMTVRNGRFVDVGSNEMIRPRIGPATEVVDLAGRTVVPGFNDAHLHAVLLPARSVDLSDAEHRDEIVRRLQARARETEPGQWVLGYGYDDTATGGHLDRGVLDRVGDEHPVFVFHASLHLYAVNSIALTAAGISSETPDPQGGRFERDANGAPTGLISERPAMEMLFVERQPSFMPNDLSTAVAGLEDFIRKAHRVGITSYTDAMVPVELALAYWWLDPESKGMRVNLLLDGEDMGSVSRLTRARRILGAIGLDPFDTPWIRAAGVKRFHGHSLSGRTARLFEPYADRPDYYGEEPQIAQPELDEKIAEIHELGLQAAIHANGDYEVDMVLLAIERAVSNAPRDHRHRLEHASIMNEALLAKARDLRVVIAPHSYIYEKGPMIEAYGEARWPHMFANASIIEHGIANAANSDFPVSGLSPLLRIQSLVTRTSKAGKTYGAEQRITVDQALHAYTMGGAFASFEEDVKGSITPGKYADFAVLSDDPRDVAPNRISEIDVLATYSGGQLRTE